VHVRLAAPASALGWWDELSHQRPSRSSYHWNGAIVSDYAPAGQYQSKPSITPFLRMDGVKYTMPVLLKDLRGEI
jgi:hypothetical protein